MPVNPKSLKNLNKGRWVKGESGNPDGRPKKLPDLDKLLIEVLGEEKDGKSALLVMLMALRSKATKGDVNAFQTLIERAYGKLTLQIESKNVNQTIMVGDSETASEIKQIEG